MLHCLFLPFSLSLSLSYFLTFLLSYFYFCHSSSSCAASRIGLGLTGRCTFLYNRGSWGCCVLLPIFSRGRLFCNWGCWFTSVDLEDKLWQISSDYIDIQIQVPFFIFILSISHAWCKFSWKEVIICLSSVYGSIVNSRRGSLSIRGIGVYFIDGSGFRA